MGTEVIVMWSFAQIMQVYCLTLISSTAAKIVYEPKKSSYFIFYTS